MKIVVPIALSLAATLIAVIATRLISRTAFRAELPSEGALAGPAPAI